MASLKELMDRVEGADASPSTTTVPEAGMTFNPGEKAAPTPPSKLQEFLDRVEKGEVRQNAAASLEQAPVGAQGVVGAAGPTGQRANTTFVEDMLAFPFPQYFGKNEKDGGVINPELEKTPDFFDMPELQQYSKHAMAMNFGTLATGPDEIIDLMKKHFPDVKMERKGAYIEATSKEDGQKYTFKPGWRMSDTKRGVAGGTLATMAAAALLPEALASAPLAASMGAGFIGTLALEDLKILAGGKPNPAQVVAGTLLPGVLHGAGNLAKGAMGKIFPAAEGALAPAEGAVVPGRIPLPSPGEQGVPPVGAAGVAGAAETPVGVPGTAEDLAAVRQQMRPLPVEPPPPAQQIPLPPPGEQGVPPVPTPRVDPVAQGLQERANQIMDFIGGAFKDQSKVNKEARGFIGNLVEEYRSAASKLYARVNEELGHAEVDPQLTLNTIEEIAGGKERIGTLPAWVRDIYKTMSGEPLSAVEGREGAAVQKPLYSKLDRMTRDVGARLPEAGPIEEFSPDQAIAKKLYGQMRQDQIDAARAVGGKSLETALEDAKKLTQQRFDFQQRIRTAFGNQVGDALAGDVTDKVGRSLPGMSQYGATGKLVKYMEALPEESREPLLRSVLANKFANPETGSLDVPKAGAWFRGVLKNEEARNAIRKYAGDETWQQLHDINSVDLQMKARATEFAQEQAAGKASDKLAKNELAQQMEQIKVQRREAQAAANRTANEAAKAAGNLDKAATKLDGKLADSYRNLSEATREVSKAARTGDPGKVAAAEKYAQTAREAVQKASEDAREIKAQQSLARQKTVEARRAQSEAAKAAKETTKPSVLYDLVMKPIMHVGSTAGYLGTGADILFRKVAAPVMKSVPFRRLMKQLLVPEEEYSTWLRNAFRASSATPIRPAVSGEGAKMSQEEASK